MGVGSKDVQAATAVARLKLVELATAMEIRVKQGSPAGRLLTIPDGVQGIASAVQALPSQCEMAALELHATHTAPLNAMGHVAVNDPRVTETLTDANTRTSAQEFAAAPKALGDGKKSGLSDLEKAMVEDYKLNDVLRMILEIMNQAMQFHHIIFCMCDAKTETMTGRFGLGNEV